MFQRQPLGGQVDVAAVRTILQSRRRIATWIGSGFLGLGCKIRAVSEIEVFDNSGMKALELRVRGLREEFKGLKPRCSGRSVEVVSTRRLLQGLSN